MKNTDNLRHTVEGKMKVSSDSEVLRSRGKLFPKGGSSSQEGVYILECIPKKEGMKEGLMLFEFLKMEIPEKVELKFIRGKRSFFDTLNKNNFKMVHISCHGKYYDGELYIQTPKGQIHPDQFYKNDRLKGRNVVITGCSLGRKDFAEKFLVRTEAESLIAPMNDIEFLDSAMWCVNFYYILLKKNYSFGNAFDYMKDNFYVKGAMQMWQNEAGNYAGC